MPMSGDAISRFRWVIVAVAAALLVVPLAAPSNLAATSRDGEVTLSWTDPNNDAITKYQISTDGGSNFINILCDSSMATGHTVTGLTNGTTYTFQVRAYDNSGPGASATVTATPLFDAPTELTAWPAMGMWRCAGLSRKTAVSAAMRSGSAATAAGPTVWSTTKATRTRLSATLF